MIEIKYQDNLEAADVTGHTVAETRRLYEQKFRIDVKAAAYLNGKKVAPAAEDETTLNDEDTLMFRKTGNHRLAYIAGALILALAVTGGIYAYGFNTGTTSIAATISNADFASVTANTSNLPSWTAHGLQRGDTGTGTLFDIDTMTSGYTGDFTVTVSIANSADIINVYRTLVMNIEIRDSADNIIDINGDGFGNDDDFSILTLNNGSVTLNVTQSAPDVYTVNLRNGYFICNPTQSGWSVEISSPALFCEVAQK